MTDGSAERHAQLDARVDIEPTGRGIASMPANKYLYI